MVLLKRRYILCILILVISKEWVCHNFANKHEKIQLIKTYIQGNVIKNHFLLDHMNLQTKIVCKALVMNGTSRKL
jgi:hypothetical protein